MIWPPDNAASSTAPALRMGVRDGQRSGCGEVGRGAIDHAYEPGSDLFGNRLVMALWDKPSYDENAQMDTSSTIRSKEAVPRPRSGPTPTHHRIAELLRQAIVEGEYLDGERLVVDDLARRYETSAMPVRQALHQLESEGLVETVLNRGARVRRVDRSLAENLYDLRRAVLALLVERCIERMTEDDIATLVTLERNARTAGTPEEGFERNESFLAKIGEIADIPLASEVLSRSWPLMCAVRRVYGVRDRRIGRDDRKRLLDAIERRDASAAVAIVVETAQAAKADLIERITHTGEDRGPNGRGA